MPLTYKYFWSTLNYKKIPFWTKKKMCLNIFSSHSCMRTYSIFRNNFIPLHVTFVTNAVLKSLTWTNMCQQFMKERNRSNVNYVTIALLRILKWTNIWHHFMKEIIKSSVKFDQNSRILLVRNVNNRNQDFCQLSDTF